MGGEVSLKLPFILGHVDDGDADKLDSALAPHQHAASKIIEEECGQDECGGNTLLLQDHSQLHEDGALTTPSKNGGLLKSGSRMKSENIVSFENDPVAFGDKLKISHTTMANVADAGDIDDDDRHGAGSGDGNDEHAVNIITAQIHHHQPPNEEQTDC